jgi:hypothetical protein
LAAIISVDVPFAAMDVVLVAVTTPPAALIVQFVPVPIEYVIPAGSVSTTVIVPDVASAPMLLTVML